jgi:HK97 family phage prohead protease
VTRPHEGLIRADAPGYKLRTSEDGGMPTLTGRFAAPGEWTEIRSVAEGHFFERFAPGAFDKTIKESGPKMKVLFHHGLDPRLGMQVLGKIDRLDTDTSYEVPLFDTPEVRSLLPGLEAGVYGSSFKFGIVKEDVNDKPKRTDANPEGIMEVTITEARVKEFGPTPLPAYETTSAGLRSVTDEFLLASLQADPERLSLLVDAIRAAALQEAKEEPVSATSPALEPQHSAEPETREEVKPSWLLE